MKTWFFDGWNDILFRSWFFFDPSQNFEEKTERRSVSNLAGILEKFGSFQNISSYSFRKHKCASLTINNSYLTNTIRLKLCCLGWKNMKKNKLRMFSGFFLEVELGLRCTEVVWMSSAVTRTGPTVFDAWGWFASDWRGSWSRRRIMLKTSSSIC